MKKILLVDDEFIIRKLARNTLSSQNYEILEAGEGDTAIRLAKEQHPDLVLLDIRMPGKSGFEVCRAIKQDPKTADIMVVMLTAELLDEDMQEGISAGAVDFFTKPFSPLELMSRIQGYLNDSPAPEEPPPALAPPRRALSSAPTGTARTSEELQAMEREQLLVYVADVTKIFREEQLKSQELKAAFEQLKDLEKMKDVFISLVSHELRSPLSVIKGYVHLMDEVLRSSEVAEEMREFMGAILGSGDRLEGLIQELLDFSKMKSGLVIFEKTDVNVPATVQLVAQEMLPLIRDKNQQLKIEVKSDFRAIKADSERLKEAVSHLLRNAVTYTPEGGSIRIECEDEGLWVKIRVSDTGPGIPPEERDRIFTPFYQSQHFPVRNAEGLGLGLSIAKHIVDDHGGSISVETAEGGGAQFLIRLPRSYEDAREMVAEFQSRYPSKMEDLTRNLQATEKQVLTYAQELSTRLAQEKLKSRQLEDSLAEMEQTYFETIAALANATDLKDAYNLGHTERVTHYAQCIARELSPALLEQRDFKYSLLLHDLGKIGIAEELLKKAGRLSDAEWETLKSHSELGARLLSSVRFLGPALASVRSHHERYDGKGYPDGLRGDEIPLPARIIAVADAFEAMTSDRPYRAGLPLEEARDEIATHAGTQFDPAVVDAFLRCWGHVEAYVRLSPEPRSATRSCDSDSDLE